MTDNNLFESIINSGKEQADAIAQEAEKKAQEIIAKAMEEAESNSAEIAKNAEAKALNMKNAALSSSSLITRNAVLKSKRAEIDKTLDGIIEYIISLDDESYFSILYSMAESVEENSGTVFLNENDLKRLPADFTSKLKKAGIDAEIGKESVDIKGGFILRCGAIEANCSLEAVIEDKKNELEDFINRELFVEES